MMKTANFRSAGGHALARGMLRGAIVLGMLAALLARAEAAEPKRPAAPAAKKAPAAVKAAPADPYAWQNLFDGKTLKGWKAPNFGGQGEVTVKDGAIHIGMGDSMSGVTYTGKPLRMDFELEFDAKRVEGNDFFCTTTFPVGDAPCSLVVGGWGGAVVGLSCVDFYDASDNATTKFMDFKNKQWYKVRIQVTKPKIEAWIDDEKVVDLATAGHRFSIRDECDLCQPLGISTWCTAGAVKSIRLRQIKPE